MDMDDEVSRISLQERLIMTFRWNFQKQWSLKVKSCLQAL
eukprot:SAG22_NODE_2313_length_2730_cov_331.980236_2_plen_40_part_00